MERACDTIIMRITACVSCAILVVGCTTAQTQMPETAAVATPTPEVTVTPAPATPVPETLEKITYSSAAVDEPYIAMTFDDGPHGTLTPELLDVLRQRGVKATFFVVGQLVQEYPQIMQRMAAEGHEIANHSWSHPRFTGLSDSAVRSQLARTATAIQGTTGMQPVLMRPPYGALTQRQRRWIHDEFGYKTIMWSVDPLDWKKPGPSVVTQRIVSGAAPGAIILAHDIHPQTVRAMPETLDQLRARGFKFVTVSELLAMERPRVSHQISAAAPASPSPTADTTPLE
jgi:peptidoglycan/xylan/chitin deacetylase (PgdA/CDA1 family)